MFFFNLYLVFKDEDGFYKLLVCVYLVKEFLSLRVIHIVMIIVIKYADIKHL